MSKKTSKVLVFAVITVLVVSMLAMVACGPKDNGDKKPDGPKALEGATAIETLSTNFADASTKSVEEKITVGGLNLNLGKGMIELALNNVNIDLKRSYDENGVLTLDAKVYNLDVALGGTTDVLGLVGGFVDKKVDLNKDKVIDSKDVLNLDKTTIAGFKNVVIEASVKIDPSDSNADTYLVCDKVSIKGLNSLPTSNGEKLTFLVDGEGYALDDPYQIIKADKPVKTNPRHVKDETVKDDADGIFHALDTYGTGEDGTLLPGTALEEFIAGNYQMASLYDFGAIEVNGTALKFNGATKFDRVYELAQTLANGYKGEREATIIKEYDDNGNYVADRVFPAKIGKNKCKYNGKKVTIDRMVDLLFGTMDVPTIVDVLVGMGDVEMTGNVVADGKNWQLKDMTSKQTINIHIPVEKLQLVVDMLKPVFGLNIPSAVGSLIPSILDGEFIKASLDVKTVSTFTYGA